jgi:poly-gamma-glutamate capsule biosynthesis protein CapA/YwtB (metallophosphatase superfamily)
MSNSSTRVATRRSTWIRLAAIAIVPIVFLALASGSAILDWSDSEISLSAEAPAALTCAPASMVTFIAVGDIMLSRGVEEIMSRAGDPTLPFRDISAELRATDFNFGNLESPVSGNDNILGKGLVFNARTRVLRGLIENNFRVLQLANNHALDQGRKGLQSTRDQVRSRGIATVGTGDDLEEAWRPQIVEVNGIRIAFIAASYASVNDGGVTRNQFVARTDDLTRLAEAVGDARRMADFVVVAMHAGIEYTRTPEKGQVTFAHAAVDVGADIVIGGHPHWVQTNEIYNGKPIYYSLGNFIFDQHQPGTQDGLILKVQLQKEWCGIQPKFTLLPVTEAPIRIEGGGIPRLKS